MSICPDQLSKQVSFGKRTDFRAVAAMSVVDLTWRVDWRSKPENGLFPHQATALRILRDHFHREQEAYYMRSVLLVMPMGSGKTRVVGELCGDYRRSLVIVPPQLIPHTADLLKEGAGPPVDVYEAPTGDALAALCETDKSGIVVTSFKISANVFGHERRVSETFEFTAVDEAHLLPTFTMYFPDGQRKRMLFLSATPDERLKLADVIYELKSTPELLRHCAMDQGVLFTAVKIDIPDEKLLEYWTNLWDSAARRARRSGDAWVMVSCCYRALERLVPLGERGRAILDYVLSEARSRVVHNSEAVAAVATMSTLRDLDSIQRLRDDELIDDCLVYTFRREHDNWWAANCWGMMPSFIGRLERGSRLVYVVDRLADVKPATERLRAASAGERSVHAGDAKRPGDRLGVVLHHDCGERYRRGGRSRIASTRHLEGGHWPMRLQKKLLTAKPPRHRVLGNASLSAMIWEYIAPPAYIFVVSRRTVTVGFNLQNHADGMFCSKKPGEEAKQLAGRWARANGRRRTRPPEIFYPIVVGTDESPLPTSLSALMEI